MIEHCVFLTLRDPGARAEVEEACAILAALVGRVDGMTRFVHGPNRDYEGKSPEIAHGFVCAFRDRAAHLAYEAHPDHRRAAAMLVAASRGGAEGILVVDLETASPG